MKYLGKRQFSFGFLSIMGGMALEGCDLIDQRTFNPDAGRRPSVPPPPPPAAPPPPVPPLVEFSAGTPAAQWEKTLKDGAKQALARKASVLFVVQFEAAGNLSPDGQHQHLENMIKQDGSRIVQVLVDGGVPAPQIEMSAHSWGGNTDMIKVYVK